MLGYLSLDIVCSSKLTIFLELSENRVRFSEQIMSKVDILASFRAKWRLWLMYATRTEVMYH